MVTRGRVGISHQLLFWFVLFWGFLAIQACFVAPYAQGQSQHAVGHSGMQATRVRPRGRQGVLKV